MTPSPRHPRAGFTLLELSVVLVVIGLVAGGILSGYALIASAQLRAQVSQLDQLDTAALAFELKYNCLPGDCAAAIRYGLGTAGGPGDGGDGNEAVYADPHMTQYAFGMKETLNFGYHLQRAGLIAGNVTGHDFGPALFDGRFTGRAVAGRGLAGVVVSPMTIPDGGLLSGSAFLVHGGDNLANPGFLAALTAAEAHAIDTKLGRRRPGNRGGGHPVPLLRAGIRRRRYPPELCGLRDASGRVVGLRRERHMGQLLQPDTEQPARPGPAGLLVGGTC